MAFKTTLDLTMAWVAPSAQYYDVSALRINGVKVLESYILLLAVLRSYPRNETRASVLLFWLVSYLGFFPMLSVYGLRDQSRIFMYVVTLSWALIASSIRVLPQVRIFRGEPAFSRPPIFWSIVLAILGWATFLVYTRLGLSIVFDPVLLYEARLRFVEAQLPVQGYPIHWAAAAVVPVLIAYLLHRRRFVAVAVVIALQLFLAAAVGNKSYLLVLMLVVFLYAVSSRRNTLALVGVGFSTVVAGAALFSWLTNDASAYRLLAMRPFVVPGQLPFYYYDYFHAHGVSPLTYLFNYFLPTSIRVHDPYAISPDYLIGREYFGSEEIAAVSGLFADAYMNLGFFGLAVWGAGLVWLLILADAAADGLSRPVVFASLAFAAQSLSGTYLVRVLITGGFLLTLLLLLVAPREAAGSYREALR